MKLNVIKTNKKMHITSSHVMWLAILIFFSIAGCYISEIIEPNTFLNTLFLISIITPIGTNIYGNYEFFPMNFSVTSLVFLEPKFIEFEEQKIPLTSIKNIEFDVNDFYGMKIVQNLRPYGSGPKLSRGANNKMKIHIEGSEEILINFQLNSKQQLQELANWVKSLYKLKLQIIESYEHGKSYGLEHLNYDEIQEFKKKYADY